MRVVKDFLVEYVINGVTITDYIAYVDIDGAFALIGGDQYNNKEKTLTFDEFSSLVKELDLGGLFTQEEINLYFKSQTRKLD